MSEEIKQATPVEETEKKKDDVILSVKDLTVDFRSDEGFTQAVRGVSFDLKKGETLCIVGESGSGKSVSCKTIMGILGGSAIIRKGSIMYHGEDLTKISEDEFHRIRGNQIGMIFQDPLSALDPIVRIGKQITEAMMVNKNRLKIKFQDLILNELSAYNALKSNILRAKGEIKICKADQAEIKKFKETSQVSIDYKMADLRAEHKDKLAIHPELAERFRQEEEQTLAALKAERNRRIEEKVESAAKKKKQAHENLKKVKAETREPLKEAKAKLNAAKKRAKVEVRKYKEEAKKTYEEHLAAIMAQYPEKEIVGGYQACLKSYQDAVKVLNRQRKADLKKLSKQRDLDNTLASKIKECNISYDEKIKEAYKTILEEAENKYKERQDKIDQCYFKDWCEKVRYSKKYAKARALSVMKEVGIPQAEERFHQYPFEFSGGMRQRIVIAIALTANPEILICDEPTTALDVTIQAQILELINRLKDERHMSVIFITHDMGVVAEMADRICVMYAGKIVEYGTAYDIFYNPKHPYTWALLSSIPDLDSKEKLEAIPGTPPNMNFPPEGDAFALRSKYAMAIDFKKMPPFFQVSKTHYAATWLLDPRAPKVEMPRIVSRRIEISLKKAGVTYEQLEQQEEKLD